MGTKDFNTEHPLPSMQSNNENINPLKLNINVYHPPEKPHTHYSSSQRKQVYVSYVGLDDLVASKARRIDPAGLESDFWSIELRLSLQIKFVCALNILYFYNKKVTVN